MGFSLKTAISIKKYSTVLAISSSTSSIRTGVRWLWSLCPYPYVAPINLLHLFSITIWIWNLSRRCLPPRWLPVPSLIRSFLLLGGGEGVKKKHTVYLNIRYEPIDPNVYSELRIQRPLFNDQVPILSPFSFNLFNV